MDHSGASDSAPQGQRESYTASAEDLALREKQRLRELFKYVFATLQSVGFVNSDIESEEGYDPGAAKHSADPILNSLAQLAACRLSCDRAFISLIDNEHQYVIAEATREISLYDPKKHPPDAGLSVGARPLDLLAGVCAGTMPAFLDEYRSTPYCSTSNIYADNSRYVINDFTMEDMYKERPYVAGFPFMRYYAEVPLRSPRGYVIGTLAVVDNKPRTGLDDSGFLALTEISTAIMKHLQDVKGLTDHTQSRRLLRGLNTFVQRTDAVERTLTDTHQILSVQDPSHEESNFPDTIPEHTNPPDYDTAQINPLDDTKEQMRSADASISKQSDTCSLENSLMNSSSGKLDPTLSPISSDQPFEAFNRSTFRRSGPRENQRNSFAEGPPSPKRRRPNQDDEESDGARGIRLRDAAISYDVQNNFASAAEILRRAMELDGVIFLNAASSHSASHTDTSVSSGRRESLSHPNTYQSSSESSDDEPAETVSAERDTKRPRVSWQIPAQARGKTTSQRRPSDSAPTPSMAGRLGFSTCRPSKSSNNVILSSHFSLPEKLNQSLLRRFPKGHIFDFNSYDHASSRGSGRKNSAGGSVESNEDLERTFMKTRDIYAALLRILPDVSSAVFIPLWNPHKACWFAGALGWTTRYKRILARDDLAYFSVFGNSIMAEVTRLGLRTNDKAKSDFISSISHELRSPLHGILGSAELLEDGSHSPDQLQMIHMIESCAHTMLDTMEHILDFAKISTSSYRPGSKHSQIEKNPKNEIRNGDSHFELDKVVEETVESLVLGHRYHAASARRLASDFRPQSYATLGQNGRTDHIGKGKRSNVEVVVDIEKQSTWLVRSEIADWRRIILNLLGNALKYTLTGLIEVTLRVQDESEPQISGSHPQIQTVLTIRDTGRGIAKEFLENHLFTPFIQEDGLSDGAGLGLSIVQKIVYGLGGSIYVQSEVGVGAQFEVFIPVTVVTDEQLSRDWMPQSKGRLCLLEFNVYPDIDTNPTGILPTASKAAIAVKDALTNYAKLWFGLEVSTSERREDALDADIIVINERDLPTLVDYHADGRKMLNTPPGSSIIIVSMEDSIDDSYMIKDSQRVQCLRQPFGPRRMAAAIQAALAADRTSASAEVVGRLDSTNGPPSTVQSETSCAEKHQSTTSLDSMVATGQPNLLLVDDNDVNLKILMAHMRKIGCSYTTATDGQEALDAYKNAPTPFDYVLMDVSMPVMNGFAAAQGIRSFEREEGRTATKIIALTGLGDAGAEQTAFASGMDLFLTKPVSMKKLQVLIEQGLDALR